MSERKINLEEILFNSKFNELTLDEKQSIKNGLINFNFEEIKIAMKASIKEALELAAENADADIDADESTYIEGNDWIHVVNKQSILDTIKQIE